MESAESPRSTAPAARSLQLLLECDFMAVRQGAAQVRAFLKEQGLQEKDLWACELAFVEGCNNAVQNTPPANSDQKILVELAFQPTHLELRINDHTCGFNLPVHPGLPQPEDENGRGLYLMTSL